MTLEKVFLICLTLSLLDLSGIGSTLAPLTSVLPLPSAYQTANLVVSQSFDYISNPPTNILWTADLGTDNSSDGVKLTSLGNPQGVLTSANRIGSSIYNWRIELAVEPVYNASATAGQCGMLGILLTDATSPPTYDPLNDVNNFWGLGYWHQICPGGRSAAVWRDTTTAGVFTPPGTSSFSTCSNCGLTASTLDRFQIILQNVNEELTGVMMHNSFETPVFCFSRGSISGASGLISSGNAVLNLVGLNGIAATIKVTNFYFYQLVLTGAAAGASIVYSTVNPNIDVLPLPKSVQQAIKQVSLSFDQATVTTPGFLYTTQGPSSVVAGMVSFSPSLGQQGMILSNGNFPSGTTNLRIEADFTITSFVTGSAIATVGSMISISILSRSVTPLDMTAAASSSTLSAFHGLLVGMQISSSGGMFIYNEPSSATGVLISMIKTLGCDSCSTSGRLSALNSPFHMVVQVFNNMLTVSVAANGASFPVTCITNYDITSGLATLIQSGSAAIQVTTYLSDNSALVSLSQFTVYELSTAVAATTTTSTTTTTQSSTSTSSTSTTTSQSTSNRPHTTTPLPLDSSETGFPIPALITGNALPVVELDDILECRNVQPKVRAPNPENATDVYFSLTIDRLLEIDDLRETVAITGTVYLTWAVNTCHANGTASSVNVSERVIVTETSSVWHPTVMFANSSNDVFMQSASYGDDMQILFLPETPFRSLYFYWTRIGIFNSKCELDLSRFPFDTQTCDFTFVMKEPTNFVQFAGSYVRNPQLSSNNQWVLDGSKNNRGSTSSAVVRNGKSSYVAVQLKFRRNPSYHFNNLLAPCYVLISLVIGSFLLPPDIPDRPAICCTVLLAFVVTQSDVLKEVPRTSRRILLSDYISMFIGLTAIVTLYDMGMCWFAKFDKHYRKIKIFSQDWLLTTPSRGFDLAGFLIVIDFFIIMNVYAADKPVLKNGNGKKTGVIDLRLLRHLDQDLIKKQVDGLVRF